MTCASLATTLWLAAALAEPHGDAPRAARDAPEPEIVAAPPPEPAEPARTAANAVFFEAFGSGLLYSVNYERIVDAWDLGFRGGVSYFTYSVSSYGRSGNLSILTLPLTASYYLGSARHKLQLGLGATVIYSMPSTDSQGTEFGGERAGLGVAASAVVGYRYLPPHGGVTFGAGFTPLLRPSRALAWGGASVGYAF